MEFSEKLQYLRKQKGLTQEELSQALYVSRTAVSKWESGRGYPNIDSIKAIASFFGVTIDELLCANELLGIAEKEHQQQQDRMRSQIFSLIDLSTIMLLFLPFFRQKQEGSIRAVSLWAISANPTWMTTIYIVIAFGILISAVITLVFSRRQQTSENQWHVKRSLALNIVGVLFMISSLQPYAAAFLFVFLMIKVFILLKRP